MAQSNDLKVANKYAPSFRKTPPSSYKPKKISKIYQMSVSPTTKRSGAATGPIVGPNSDLADIYGTPSSSFVNYLTREIASAIESSSIDLIQNRQSSYSTKPGSAVRGPSGAPS